MDCILGQNTSLNKFKKFQVIQNIFYDHNRIKLQFNNRNTVGKSPNIWGLKNKILSNTWVKFFLNPQEKFLNNLN